MTYAGPVSSLAPSRAFALTSAWAYQPKLDGCYAVARTDAAGRICSVLSRAGAELSEAADLHGILACPPHSVLVGELDAHTEAGNATAAAQGYRSLRLFDALALDGLDLRGLPYLERWGAIHRSQSLLESAGLARVDSWQDDDSGDSLTLGRPRCPVTGRRVARIPRDLRRLPVVPLIRSVADARALWRDVEAGTLEGLVAVDLTAPAGKRGAKLKIKLTDTLDVRVLAADHSTLRVQTRGGSTQQAWRDRPTFTVPSTRGEVPGTVLEVAHNGYYKSGEPRFARVVRKRSDVA